MLADHWTQGAGWVCERCHSDQPDVARGVQAGVAADRGPDDVGAVVDGPGDLSDRDMAAGKAFFESAKMVTGITPDRVTTDGHDSYPRAIRTVLGKCVRHRDSQYLNNRLEQDHRGVKVL